MEQKTDLRIVKTHKALRESLESLLLEKPLSEITVNEICERAMVRRATFYKHFGDKYELLTFLLKETRKDIEETKAKRDKAPKAADDDNSSLYADILIVLEYIEAKEPLFCALSNDQSTGMVSHLLADSFNQSIKDYLKETGKIKNASSASSELICQLLTGALFCGVTWWMNNKEQLSKEELAKQLEDFIKNAVGG